MSKQAHECKSHEALSVLTGKWRTSILLNLLYSGTLRFSELKLKLPGITQKMLTSELRELEEEGIVIRKVYPVVPPKVEYSLSDYGKTLEPILEAMHEWGKAHLDYKKKVNNRQNTSNM